MRVSLTDGERVAVASIVLKNGQVSWFTSWCAVVVCLEWIVTLEDGDIWCAISIELSDFKELNVRELIPLGVSRSVLGNPNVVALCEVTSTIVQEDRNGVCTVGSNGHIVVAITVEIGNTNVDWVTVGGIIPCSGCACVGCKGSRCR